MVRVAPFSLEHRRNRSRRRGRPGPGRACCRGCTRLSIADGTACGQEVWMKKRVKTTVVIYSLVYICGALICSLRRVLSFVLDVGEVGGLVVMIPCSLLLVWCALGLDPCCFFESRKPCLLVVFYRVADGLFVEPTALTVFIGAKRNDSDLHVYGAEHCSLRAIMHISMLLGDSKWSYSVIALIALNCMGHLIPRRFHKVSMQRVNMQRVVPCPRPKAIHHLPVLYLQAGPFMMGIGNNWCPTGKSQHCAKWNCSEGFGRPPYDSATRRSGGRSVPTTCD